MKPPRGLIKIYKGELGLAARDFVKNSLTVVPESKSSFTPMPDPIRLWHDDGDFIYVPRGYYNSVIKKRFDPKIDFKFSSGVSELRPNTPITLREGQEETISAAIDAMRAHEFGGAIVEAPTGSGKTVLGMETARRLGMKTLIVVHTSVLMEQWIKEIRKFMPNWSVGVIQGATCDTQNNDVCVAMLQSLALGEDYPEYLYDEFGLLIFDEIHVAAAAEFKKALYKFRPKYLMGLSGTLKRKDKAENVFKYGVGEVIPAMNAIAILKPVIYFIDTKYVWTGGASATEIPLDRQKVGFLKSIISDAGRNEVIMQNVVKAATSGRHVLVLSERVGHVESLHREVQKRLMGSNIKIGMMVGASSKEQRDYSEDAQVLFATVQLLAVGFNNPRLDTLVMATPIQSMTQAVGRILRHHPDKKAPFVIDLVDGSEIGRIFGRSRFRQYREKKWEIKGEQCLR